MPDPVILIVDDQPRNLQVIGNLLAEKHYCLAFAQNGTQALEAARQMPPDLILLDVMMPDINGYEVCRRLKEDPATEAIPVIFLTAKVDSEDVLEGLRAGAVDYLAKPFCSEELLTRVGTHLQLRQLTKELKIANELKSELMSIAAHDLKNPLAAIRGLTEILLGSDGDDPEFPLTEEERRNLLKDIYQCSENTLGIIKELLNTETIESGIVRLAIEQGDLGQIIAETIELNQPQARLKNIRLHNAIPMNTLAAIDIPRMREVFDNLLSNAIKYSLPGKEVFLELETHKDAYRVNVRDQGPGLTEDDKQKVFGKFQKLSARPTGGEHSTGLGLAIVKNFMELHGGSVGVESTHGQGATFYVDIPRAKHP